MLESKSGQVHDEVGIRRVDGDREGLQTFENCGDFRFGEPFPAMGHDEAIRHFIRPEKRNQRLVRLQTRKNVKIVGSIFLVLQPTSRG